MILTFLLALTAAIPNPDLKGVEPKVAAKIQRLQKEVRWHPDSAEKWGKLCMNLHVHDFLRDAVDCYNQTSSLQPDAFRWLYYQAVAMQEINSSQAAPLFEKCIRLKPDYAPLHLRYAQSLLAAGALNEAEVQFRIASQAGFQAGHAYLGLARAQFAQNKKEATRSTLLEAIGRYPDHGELHGLLSEIYRSENMPQQAEKELIVSQQLPKKIPPPDPELTPLFLEGVSSYWYEIRARTFMSQANYSAAAEQLVAATDSLQDPRLFDLLGIAYQYQKKYAKAIAAHRKALVLQPDSAGTMNNLASALLKAGEKKEAEELLLRAIGTDPSFEYSYMQLARLELQTDRPKQALEHVLAACAYDGCQDAENLDMLSQAYAANSDFQSALKTAREALTAARSEEMKKRIRRHVALYDQKKAARD